MDLNLKFRNLESDTVDCGDYIFLILATITSGLSSDLLNADIKFCFGEIKLRQLESSSLRNKMIQEKPQY